jgi:hypothetical protein
MKSNMTFLAPLLAGIVVGLGGMITLILSKLTQNISIGADSSELGFGGLADLLKVFDYTLMVPPYFLQIIIGLYIIEIIFILNYALVIVESGKDTLKEKNSLSQNLKRGLTLYIVTALISTIALSLLAVIAIGSFA